MTTSLPSRRLLVGVGMVGAPICLTAGNLLSLSTGTTGTSEAAALAAHGGQFVAAAVIQAAGFALLGAVGVGIAMLVDRRGSALATLAAVITLIGGVVMGGAVLTSAFVEVALPHTDAARLLPVLQNDPGVVSLFEFSLVSAVGGLLATVALFIGRPVRVWVTVLFLVGLLLSAAGGGPLGAVLGLPFLLATALLAGRLVRGAATPAAHTQTLRDVPVAA